MNKRLKPYSSILRRRKIAGEKFRNGFHPPQFRFIKLYSISNWVIYWSINVKFMNRDVLLLQERKEAPWSWCSNSFNWIIIKRNETQPLIARQMKLGQILNRVCHSCTMTFNEKVVSLRQNLWWWGWWSTGPGCPRRLQDGRLWGSSGPAWTKPWATCSKFSVCSALG